MSGGYHNYIHNKLDEQMGFGLLQDLSQVCEELEDIDPKESANSIAIIKSLIQDIDALDDKRQLVYNLLYKTIRLVDGVGSGDYGRDQVVEQLKEVNKTIRIAQTIKDMPDLSIGEIEQINKIL
jgi:hypothetical protein